MKYSFSYSSLDEALLCLKAKIMTTSLSNVLFVIYLFSLYQVNKRRKRKNITKLDSYVTPHVRINPRCLKDEYVKCEVKIYKK